MQTYFFKSITSTKSWSKKFMLSECPIGYLQFQFPFYREAQKKLND
jgi:hypothetical protein